MDEEVDTFLILPLFISLLLFFSFLASFLGHGLSRGFDSQALIKPLGDFNISPCCCPHARGFTLHWKEGGGYLQRFTLLCTSQLGRDISPRCLRLPSTHPTASPRQTAAWPR